MAVSHTRSPAALQHTCHTDRTSFCTVMHMRARGRRSPQVSSTWRRVHTHMPRPPRCTRGPTSTTPSHHHSSPRHHIASASRRPSDNGDVGGASNSLLAAKNKWVAIYTLHVENSRGNVRICNPMHYTTATSAAQATRCWPVRTSAPVAGSRRKTWRRTVMG
jgi:hypothetical protein